MGSNGTGKRNTDAPSVSAIPFHVLYLVAMSVLWGTSSGCGILSLLPYNYTCRLPYHGAPPHMLPLLAYSQQPPQPVAQPHFPVAPTLVAPTSARPPVRVEELKVEPAPLVIDKLLSLREELDVLKQTNVELKGKLGSLETEMKLRSELNVQATRLMGDVHKDVAMVHGKLGDWRSDLARLQGHVRSQREHHEQTLSLLEDQLNEMLSLYEDTKLETENCD